MRLKNYLIECAYWLGMLAALWLTVHSCAAHAQITVYPNETKAARLVMRQVYDHGDSALWVSTTVDSATWASWLVTEEIAPKYGWITDSIKWVATDTTFEGDSECAHEWVYGKPNFEFARSSSSFSCLVEHNGGHCDYDDDVREKICRKCLFSVIEREKWYQRYVAPPKSEFERFKEKQRAKQ